MHPDRPSWTRHAALSAAALSALLSLVCLGTESLVAAQGPGVLSPRNVEAPFCYAPGTQRRWPILVEPMGAGDQLVFRIRQSDRVLAEGSNVRFEGLEITLTDGHLSIHAAQASRIALQLQLEILRDGARLEQQTLAVRPAPAERAVSYVADLVDDLIRIYWDETAQQFRPITKDGLDQYFRRLQAQGIARLVVWQSPFPLIVDRSNYAPQDWQNYESQARAIIESAELSAAMRRTPGQKSYDWLRLLMRLRLSDDFATNFTASAAEHGIRLTASYRPFEPALAKYYQVPAFDADGSPLWAFHPLASPAVNYHADAVGFVHYRQVLHSAGYSAHATLAALRLNHIARAKEIVQRAAEGHVDFRLTASVFPPLDENSYVLVRQPEGSYRLQPYASIRSAAEQQRRVITDYELRIGDGGQLEFTSLHVPSSHPYLILEASSDWAAGLEMPVDLDVTLLAAAGNRLGRANVWSSLRGADAAARATRVAGIPDDGNYRTEFQAIEQSIDFFRAQGRATWRLGDGEIVVNQGADTTIEMLDFERPAAREYAVRELRTILQWPAFDELFVNTRSHTQLAASMADGAEGIRTVAAYRLAGQNYLHLGIDRAYAPQSLAVQEGIRTLSGDRQQVERLTTWQPGEWQGTCQSDGSSLVWRLERNRAVARGMRALLSDLQAAFPGVRIRAVIPPSAMAEQAVQRDLQEMPKADGGTYGAAYYQHVWSSLNYIPAIGEGMTLVDLAGLSIEPVFLGIRYLPDSGPLEAFFNRSIADLRNNRGSDFRGPRSFFYEAQETLRAADARSALKRRDEIIEYLLSHREEIREVLLYEAADWTYHLPLE